MLKRKLLSLFVITLIFSSFMIPTADAEAAFNAEQFPYSELQIQVMPEFDYPEEWPENTPSLLIGKYGTFTNKSGQDFEGTIEIAVPTNDNGFEPYLVAEFPDENKPEVQRPFEVDTEKGVITWKPSKAIKKDESYRFVVEYYTSSVDVKDNRSFTYEFSTAADVEALDVIFYAPINAEEITLEPIAPNKTKSDYGEELFYYQYKEVKAGDSYNYSFSYKKEGFESTLDAINQQQPPNDENHSGVSGSTATDQLNNGGTSNADRPIIGIGGASVIGIAIIIAGVFVYLGLKGRAQTAPQSSKTQKPKQQPKKQPVRKETKVNHIEEKKELRKKLLTGKIDQETYEEEMKKLV
ncbi:MAG: hypothetical protein AB2392_00870 [Neobacillus sp.]|jgi:hypothetical protein